MRQLVVSILGTILVANAASANYGPKQSGATPNAINGRSSDIPVLPRDILARASVPLTSKDLAAALRQGGPSVRLSAAVALGYVGAQADFPSMMSALGDGDEAVATSVLLSLYRRGIEARLEPSPEWKETLHRRAGKMLYSLDLPLDKLQVAMVLAKMGDPAGESVVLQQLQPGAAQVIAQEIVPLLVKIDPSNSRVTGLVGALAPLLTDTRRSEYHRAKTAAVLGSIGTREARDVLRSALSKESSEPVLTAIQTALTVR